MMNHRRLLWSLGLVGMMGLMASEVRGAPITLTISTDGTTLTVANVATPPPANIKDTSFQVNIGALNAALSSAGSAYQFNALGGNSNFAGGANGFLTVTGTLTEGGTGTALGPIVITIAETGFTAPPTQTGMEESSTAQYTNTTAGDNQSATGTYNATTLTLGAGLMTSTGPALNSYSPTTSASVSGTGSYDLTQAVTINLAPNANSPTDGFSGSVRVTGTAIPEPASMVMMMTAMPLALVGFLRHRRRATA